MSAIVRASAPRLALALSLALAGAASLHADETVDPVHGIAMHGDLAYPADFEHFAYTNPGAPKGGTLTLDALGSYDSFNQYIIKGDPAAGLGLIYDSLTTRSLDEPFSEYGLLAESIEMPDDRSWVAFTLRDDARWHDGEPVTVEDVIWSLETLKEKGRPFFRFYYQNVVKAEADGERRIKITFDGTVNRELPLIMGQLPILPKHYYEGRPFDQTSLEPPLGSGPYKIKSFEPGRNVVYERVEDYWGRDVPANRGRYNFDLVRYEYFRDANVALEGLKAGEYDIRVENSSKNWATAYSGPAVDAGWIVKEEISRQAGTGMQSFAFNLRRKKFQNPKVRRALAYAFDFEWTNENLFYGQYTRTDSFFENSELASSGLPDEAELALLEPLRDQIPPEVFTETYQPSTTDGSGNNRKNLRMALNLLKEAGWTVKGGKLTNQAGESLDFEVLLVSPLFERITAPFAKNLERLGIYVSMRTIDPAQYQNRVEKFDFDVIVGSWGQSLSPGNEQRDFWGIEAADREGSRNLLGIKNPAIDSLIDAVIQADSREALVTATRALDRVLLWNHYVIPQWHSPVDRIAYWNKFERPENDPKFGIDQFAWWIDQGKEEEVIAVQEESGDAKTTTQ
ncbi:MAG: extracellular solute-binding protein [Alphaproteobacteria bacterium]|nr:extracellular solute-binding protein [Alphaproteobacteria bacterium]